MFPKFSHFLPDWEGCLPSGKSPFIRGLPPSILLAFLLCRLVLVLEEDE